MSRPASAVWKFELHPAVTVLDLPVGARLVHVGHQGDGIYLWALVIAERDTFAGMAPVDTERRAFLTVGTGHRYHPTAFGRHVGTVQMDDGLVFHVFETALP